MLVNLIFTVVFLNYLNPIICSMQGEEVTKWADAIGQELWTLGSTITRHDEIKQTYKFLNAEVGEKRPEKLLAEIKENILRMIDRKTDAIKCIQQEAEKVALYFNASESYSYYSSKWSSIVGDTPMILPESLTKTREMYLPLKLNNDTHFYNLAVNTSHSSVHVPTNVYDKENDTAFAIQWSEALDNVFIRNYNSDPALFWQYFGSSSGIMRHYPAKRWEDVRKDLFDCRIRTWYIEAATCTKDMVILVDNSGSMKGMGHHIGSLTASSILDTLSNNDYINVLNYSASTNYSIPCFADMLVQATRENIEIFKQSIELMQPEGKTDLPQALDVAFNLLKRNRERKNCSEDTTKCNQAIMIITDGVTTNVSATVMKHNYLNNGSSIPVRIFTYLVGKEVQNADAVKWISCANRGYYTHVQTLEQVTVSVLQYINVIARPLVLQAESGEDNPISWTHAYVDRTYDDKNDNQINEPYRLLTSVAVPCYDTKTNKMNDTRTAFLLGVAGTDVPLDEFNKMTLPYKIGVNGYSFIVSNNGYVLMHPDLRPVFEGILKDNYNSIDLTQVEQHNDGLPAREIGETLEQLRQGLVDAKEGSMEGVNLSYHYDGMRRISEESYDYYFTGLSKQIPFSVGIAIPSKYGKYFLKVGNEVERNKETGENLASFFNGKWKIHPKWVYCKYHYLEGHEFKTPEQELLHFLEKMYTGKFVYVPQYEEAKKEDRDKVTCGRQFLKADAYYCDQDLVQRLIFDARSTFKFYSEDFEFKPKELASFIPYSVTVRFMATMSGLTRWQNISQPTNSTTDKTTSNNETVWCNKTISCDATTSNDGTILCNKIIVCNETILCNKTILCNETILNNGTVLCNETVACNETILCNETTSNNETIACNITGLINVTTANCTEKNSTCFSNSACNATQTKRIIKEFGELNPRAINEKWYKNAVLQHQYDMESFVYSVPFESGCLESDPLVTGSFAIFLSDGGLEAPGSVVGFQFSQNKLRDRIKNITTGAIRKDCSWCGRCNETLTCYVVDNSGYIITSLKQNDTGRFFGEIEGDIMHSMLEEKIFKEVTIFDYQGLCKIDKNEGNCATNLLTPFRYVETLVQWMIFKMVHFFLELNIYSILEQVLVYAQTTPEEPELEPEEESFYDDESQEEFTKNKKEDYYACEKEIKLYVLQQNLFIQGNLMGEIEKRGSRNYYVKRIPYSNLILVAINNTIKKQERFYYTTSPKIITQRSVFKIREMNSTLLPCQKLDLNNLPRRRLTGCYNEHPLEHEIVDCAKIESGSGYVKMNILVPFFGLSILFYI